MADFILTEVRVFRWVPCWLLARLELVPVATCVPAGLVPPEDTEPAYRALSKESGHSCDRNVCFAGDCCRDCGEHLNECACPF